MRKVSVVCFIVLLTSLATAAEKNLMALHKNAGKMSNKECLLCHSKIMKEVSLNKKYKMFHRLHLESKLATPKKCSDCHQSVDLRNGSAAALRKQVDPKICAGCHSSGSGVKGAKVLFAQ